MADGIQFPNIVGAFQEGFGFGTKQRQLREAEQRRDQLSQLASMAYGAAPEQRSGFVQQAIAADPDAGFALSQNIQKDDERKDALLLNTAKLLDAAPEEQKAALYQRIYPQVSHHLPGLPPEYNEQVGKGIKSFITARGGGSGGVKVVGNSLVNEQGQVVYESPQLVPTDQGYFTYSPSRGFQPVGMPQGQPVPAGVGADGIPNVADDAGVPASLIAMDSGARPWTANTPDTVSGGAIGPRPILPKGTAAEQRRLELAERSAARQEESARRAEESAARSERNTERTAKQTLVQGERDLRKEVSDRVKDSRTVLSAYDKIKTVAKTPNAANDRALIFSYMKMLDPGSVVREGEFANAQNAAGVPDRVVNIYNNALRGEILNNDQRQQFAASAGQIADSARRQIDDVAIEYRQIAEDYGFDPKRATGLDAPKSQQRQGRPGATKTARNPQTGEVLYLVNGQWVP